MVGRDTDLRTAAHSIAISRCADAYSAISIWQILRRRSAQTDGKEWVHHHRCDARQNEVHTVAVAFAAGLVWSTSCRVMTTHAV